MAHCSRSLESNRAESFMNHGGSPQDVSKKKNNSNYSRDHSSDILAKNVPAFCTWPDDLPEAKLKSLYYSHWQSRFYDSLVSLCDSVISENSCIDLQ